MKKKSKAKKKKHLAKFLEKLVLSHFKLLTSTKQVVHQDMSDSEILNSISLIILVGLHVEVHHILISDVSLNYFIDLYLSSFQNSISVHSLQYLKNLQSINVKGCWFLFYYTSIYIVFNPYILCKQQPTLLNKISV